MASSAPRARTGCQNCRLRHLKCDDRRAACSRCDKAGIECVRGYNIRFKHGLNPSVANLKGSGLTKTDYDWIDQPWVRTDRALTFLDETQELNSLYEGDGIESILQSIPRVHAERSALLAQEPSQSIGSTPLRPVISTPTPASLHPGSPHGSVQTAPALDSRRDSIAAGKRRRLTYSGPGSYHPSLHGSPIDIDGPGSQTAVNSQGLWDASAVTWTPPGLEASMDIGPHNAASDPSFAGLERTVSHGTGALSNSLSRVYLDMPVWPLQDPEEAKLLRHYVENLSRSFDLTDPMQHFRRIVPQRAATCPPLLNAIFALSARHLSHTTDYDHLVSNKYIQECLKHLIPMLDDKSAIQDENLLASTIILRHVEEFEVPLSGQSPTEQESHLFGAHVFITAQERATIGGGLRQAAFWVGLRQEIYMAFVNQRSIIPALEHCNIDRSFGPASDDVWACRMVVLCADIIRYCFGDEDHPQSMYMYLSNCVSEWFDSKPSSFLPIYEQPAGPDNVFPTIQLLADDVAVAMHYYYLSRILLVAHNPKIPRLGPMRAKALKAADDEVLDYVRIVCGICNSNPNMPPNYVYAAKAIVIAGDKFTDDRERAAVMEILHTCDRVHAWITRDVQANLKAAWGWSDD